jgi:hypothetical protein
LINSGNSGSLVSQQIEIGLAVFKMKLVGPSEPGIARSLPEDLGCRNPGSKIVAEDNWPRNPKSLAMSDVTLVSFATYHSLPRILNT